MCDALGIINFEDACVDITGLMDYRPASAISFLGRYRLIDLDVYKRQIRRKPSACSTTGWCCIPNKMCIRDRAKTEEQEFLSIYNMRTIVVPTNKPIARIDYPDAVYTVSYTHLLPGQHREVGLFQF